MAVVHVCQHQSCNSLQFACISQMGEHAVNLVGGLASVFHEENAPVGIDLLWRTDGPDKIREIAADQPASRASRPDDGHCIAWQLVTAEQTAMEQLQSLAGACAF